MTKQRRKLRRKHSQRNAKMPTERSHLRIGRIFGWLGTTGLLTLFASALYQHVNGTVSVEFVQPIVSGYEFQIKNDTPSDRVVNKLRFSLRPQDILFTQTADASARDASPAGTVVNAELSIISFRELDGVRIPANQLVKFRVPRLVSKSDFVPFAAIVDVTHEIRPANPILGLANFPLQLFGIGANDQSTRYLVIDNYWTITKTSNINEAVRVICRDHPHLRAGSICDRVR